MEKILIKVKKATIPPMPPPLLNLPGGPAALEPVTSPKTLAPSKNHDNGDSGASGSEDERGAKSKKKKTKICDSLSRLGIYTHSEHFHGFDQKEAKNPPHVFSIGEREIVELHNTYPDQMLSHNREFFMRAYPAGRRIDSSNPDPSVFWRKGVQMVALNWQSWDEGTMLNEAMFAGEDGWVLKPPAYRSHEPPEMPPSIQRVTIDFRITILAGQHVPLPAGVTDHENFFPYVKCELHVDKADGLQVEEGARTKEGKYKRITKSKKTDHPDWGEEGVVLDFPNVPNVIEDLSFFRLKVEDERYSIVDRLAAWTCIRLDRLQQGYRLLKLLDCKGQATDGLMLVKIEKTVR